MNVTGLIGQKIDQGQAFLEDGTRVPISSIQIHSNVVTQIKHTDHDRYHALQLGWGQKKSATRALSGHSKKAGLTHTPRFFREVRVEDEMGDVGSEKVEAGKEIKAEEVFAPGDVVDVISTSKGKGFAGVVKRHGFHGGPRTHGQSDRERAPGSIGQTTTPGRVYRGKRMAGHMGNDRVTIKNLTVLDVTRGTVLVGGLIPGPRGGLVMVRKAGKTNKKFVPLYKEDREVKIEEVEKIEGLAEPAENGEGLEAKSLEEDTGKEVAPETEAALPGSAETAQEVKEKNAS